MERYSCAAAENRIKLVMDWGIVFVNHFLTLPYFSRRVSSLVTSDGAFYRRYQLTVARNVMVRLKRLTE